MNNLFVTNPIKVSVIGVNIASKKVGINKLIVFIGRVPKNVHSELEKLRSLVNSRASGIIKRKFPNIRKFYGANWVERLGIDIILKESPKRGGEEKEKSDISVYDGKRSFAREQDIRGGEADTKEEEENINFDFDSPVPFETDVNELLKDVKDQVKTKNNEISDSIIEPSNVPAEEADEEDLTEISIEEIFKTRKKKKIKYASIHATIQWVFDELKIYPFDKVSEFKLKIYSITKIPPYMQHLWTKYKGHVYPLAYNILKSNITVFESVENLLEQIQYPQAESQEPQKQSPFLKKEPKKQKKEQETEEGQIGFIEGIPVNREWYRTKDRLKVVANDEFTILHNYYSKYGTTHYSILDLNSVISEKWDILRETFRTDQYQRELFYYSLIFPYWPMITRSVFDVLVQNENEVKEIFPELVKNINNIKTKYSKEYDITDQYDILTEPKNRIELKKIQSTIKSAIISGKINFRCMGESKEPILYLRNVFDYFDLDEHVDYCQAKLLHDGKRVIMEKAFNKNPLASKDQIFQVFNPAYHKITLNSILFRIRLNPKKTTESLYLNIFQNGNYIIVANWQEELYYGFDDVYRVTESVVQPIIKKINCLGSNVLYYSDTKLCLMNKNLAKFTEIGLGIFWKSPISEAQFSIIKRIAEEFRSAGIMNPATTLDDDALEYYFSKGMYKFDSERIEKVIPVKNYYEHMSNGIVQQKWASIFQKTRKTKIFHRLNDIKIEIIGITRKEYNSFVMYMKILFYIYVKNCTKSEKGCSKKIQKTPTVTLTERIKRKTLTDNKQQDPELYNSRKLYKTNFIYSRVCQKPYQPLMLSELEYAQLNQNQKKRAVKYWNFTSRQPVYYLSMNLKYPYIKFITNKHPKKYCIPCAKKTPISDNPKDLKRIMHDTCLTKHIWDKETKTITEKSRYIMSYGKPIELNRLSRLPEESLEPIFYDSYSSSGAMDQECATGSVIGYYLYGVNQNLFNLSNVGYIFCLSFTLGYDISTFFKECKKRIEADPSKFRVLLNGNVCLYFPGGYKDFITTLSVMERGWKLASIELEQMGDKWNVLFENIAFIYFSINTIRFEDKSPLYSAENQIEMILPPRMNNVDDFAQDTHKNLLILKRNANCLYYPIYRINTEIFYKTKIIEHKLFSTKNESIQILIKIAMSKFKSVEKENINLSVIKRFTRENNQWEVTSLFINKNNFCYTVEMKTRKAGKKKIIFIPIKMSFYSLSKGVNLIYEPLNPKKNINNMSHLNSFILTFNNWIAKISEEAGFVNHDIPKSRPLKERIQPIIPFIELDSWVLFISSSSSSAFPASSSFPSSFGPLFKKGAIIGFVSQNLMYYIAPISVNTANKIKKTKFRVLRNNPYDVNLSIRNYIFDQKRSVTKEDIRRNKELNRSTYKHFLYRLFLLEFITMFSKQKNNSLRKKIKSLIVKTNFSTESVKLLSKLKDIISDMEDMKKIGLYISNYRDEHHDKKQLLQDINITRFNFDVIEMEKFKNMDKDKLKKELHKLSKKIIVAGTPKYADFENYLMSCAAQYAASKVKGAKNKKGERGYCKKQKLIMPKDKIDKYIDVLAADIMNPIKSKWIFSSIFIEKVISYFKFIKRPFEVIRISLD